MSNPWGKLSKAWLKSTDIVPTILPVSLDFFQTSIIFIRMVWQLYVGLNQTEILRI